MASGAHPCGPVTLRLHREPAGAGDRVVARALGSGCWTGSPTCSVRPTSRTVSASGTNGSRSPRWSSSTGGSPDPGLVLDSLVPAIIEQRVTGKQAFGAYRQLVRHHGRPAPGPWDEIAALRLMVPPDIAGWRRIPSWQWLRAGVDARRAAPCNAPCRWPNVWRYTGLPREKAWQRLRSVSGIGVWTAAETMQRAAGDADAVSFGDYHVAKDIGHALTGAPADDVQLEQLLRPYAGHRYRVQHLVAAGRLGAPRHGARLAIPTHLPG